MSNSWRSKDMYYGNTNSHSYNDELIQNLSVTTASSNSTSMTTNSTNSSLNNATYRQFQHESSVSSTQVGFFLFLLGLFACAIFLYLLKNRMNVASASNRSSNQSNTASPQDSEADATAIELLENMSPKERRHYIDSVLRVKSYESPNNDIECPDTTTTDVSTNLVSMNDLTSVEPMKVEPSCKDNKVDMNGIDDNDVETLCIEELSLDELDRDHHPKDDDSESTYDVVNSTVPCCAICLDKFDIGDDISYSMDTTQCQHEYHTICITEWLMKHPNCPYCRRNYIPLPTPPATGVEAVASTDTVETQGDTEISGNIVTPTTVALPDLTVPPPPPPLDTSNERIRTFGYPVMLTSFWRRPQLQPRPSENVDIESGRIITTISITAQQAPSTSSNSSSVNNSNDDFITI